MKTLKISLVGDRELLSDRIRLVRIIALAKLWRWLGGVRRSTVAIGHMYCHCSVAIPELGLGEWEWADCGMGTSKVEEGRAVRTLSGLCRQRRRGGGGSAGAPQVWLSWVWGSLSTSRSVTSPDLSLQGRRSSRTLSQDGRAITFFPSPELGIQGPPALPKHQLCTRPPASSLRNF